MSKHNKELVKNERTGEHYTHVKHPSGLDVFIWKMDGFTSTHAYFATKYGSVNTRFKTKNDSDFVEVPEGIAHFLEHKLFESEDGDVTSLFAGTGASANAFTSFEITCYLFECSENYEKSLEILLKFVQEPYFTKETVDKEMGIIGQEIKMCEDSPARQVFYNLLKGLFVNNPVKIDIAGTVESIAKIDADLLYRCYNTFYNLNNMVLAIAGNVDEDEVLRICDEYLKPCEDVELVTDFPNEPMSVAQKLVEQKMPVGTPLFQIGFKAQAYRGTEMVRKELEAGILLELLFGSTSAFYKQLTDEGLINSSFGIEVFNGDSFFASVFGGESHKPHEVFERAVKEIERCKVEGLPREEFDIIKKSRYGATVRGLNDVENCTSLLMSAHFAGVGAFEIIESLADITFEDVSRSLSELFDPDCAVLSIVSNE